MDQHTARTDTDGDRTGKAAGRVGHPDASTTPGHLDRRGALRLGATAGLGISALSLPMAAAATSPDPRLAAAPDAIVGEFGTIGVTHTTIQEAVNDVPSGGRIEVREGSYAEEVVTGSKHLQFIGDGSGTTTIVGSITFGSTVGTAASLTGSSSVSGFAFERPASVAAGDATYKMIAASGGSHDVTISASMFDLQSGATEPPTPGMGAALSGTARWTVTGNLFMNQEHGGSYVSRTLYFENAGTSIIHDNEFVMPSVPQGQAVFLTGASPSDSQITSNRFSGGLALALGISERVLVQGNDFEGGTRVRPEDNPNAIIRNNRFTSAVFFAVGTTNVAVFTENDISFGGFPPSATETFRGKTVFNGARDVTLDASKNWWGSPDAPTTVATLDPYDNPVIVEPRIFSFTDGAAPPGFNADRGFWPTGITFSTP
jgi:hypothetical protein